jgi:hypothetical protein
MANPVRVRTSAGWQDLALVGPPGPQGPPGAPGTGVGGSSHVQGTPAALWTINHALDFQPNVVVVDSAGNQVEGDVRYLDADTLTIAFSAAFSGTAYLS